MSKATITNVTVNENTYVVTYSTGTVRKYPEDKLPQTVQSWLNQRNANINNIMEQAKTSTPDQDEEIIDRVIENMVNPNPDTEALRKNIQKDLWRERDYWRQTEWKPEKELPVVSHNGEVVPVVETETTTPEPKKSIFWCIMDGLSDIYFFLTTYIPIGLRWLFVHLVWLIQDYGPTVATYARKATVELIKATCVVVILTVALANKAIIIWKEGWKFRKELMAEYN